MDECFRIDLKSKDASTRFQFHAACIEGVSQMDKKKKDGAELQVSALEKMILRTLSGSKISKAKSANRIEDRSP